jgi:TonB family protein
MPRFLILVLPLLAGAPALAAQSRAEQLLSDAPAPRGRRCEILRRTPREYAAALDSVALRQVIGTLPPGDSAGSVLYSVRWDERGNPLPPVPIENALAAEREMRIREAVAAGARRVQASEPWSLRVRVDAGQTATMRFGRSERCRVMRDPTPTREVGSVVVTGSQLAELNAAGDARVEVRVSASGAVVEARLAKSSGSNLKDDMALEGARSLRYLPELVDGIAVEGVYELSRSSR